MTHPEPIDTAPDTRPPARGWVWHSTDASIAAGQISLLSVLETFCALGLYGWLAFHFDHQWWLLISAVAAPIILLRSSESSALGLNWMNSYLQSRHKRWYNSNIYEKRLFFATPFIIILSALWVSVYTAEIADDIFYLITITFLGFFSIASPIAIIGINSGAGALISGTVLIIVFLALPLASIGIDAHYLMQAILMAFMATTIASITSLILSMLFLKNKAPSMNNFILIMVLPFFALGVWLRSLGIRIFASSYFPIKGVQRLPYNWLETLWIIDIIHPPELLPNANQISNQLTIRGILQEIYKQNNDENISFYIFVFFWYPPALLWRWSLKATLWLWFPLALLLRPDKATDNVGKVRKDAVTQIWVSSPLLWVAIVVALWLGTGHFPPETVQSWAELAGENAGKWLEKLLALATPPNGLIEAALWLCCSLVGLVWLYSQYVQKQSPKTLAEEDAIYDMHPEPKQLFLIHSRWLERLYVFLVVSFILLGYAVVLHLANQHYPAELGRFIPVWLLNWL